MGKPLVSYVIPCYNAEATIASTVYSIKDSGKESWDAVEIILVDDGSTDATGLIIESLCTELKNIQIAHITNQGKGAARNFGNKMAKADIIAVMDADDWNVADRASAILMTFEKHPEADIFYSGFVSKHIYDGKEVPFPAGPINEKLLRDTGTWGISHSAVAYRKKVILEVPYSLDRNKDDWNMLWNFYTKGYKFCFVVEPLVVYRVDIESIKENPEELIKYEAHLLEKKKKIMESFFKEKENEKVSD